MARYIVPIALLGTLSATSASAAPGTLFGHDVLEVEPLTAEETQQRRESFETMLEDKGWAQIDDQVLPVDAGGRFAQPPVPPQLGAQPPHRATIFLNFFGQEDLSPGTNSAENESNCLQQVMDWPGFGGGNAQALALIDVFEINMEPYGVRIAYDERPPSHLPYAMVMMGGTPDLIGLGGGVLGVSCSPDCADMWWRDTTFAFTGAINLNNAEVLGTTALHEAAHAFGLAHIDNPQRIMNPFVGGGTVTWADECTPYNDATGGINCQATHASYCDGNPAQNTNAELMAYFGANSPDIVAPTVELTMPTEDQIEVEVGESFMIEVEVSDDHEGYGWRLVVPELEQEIPVFNNQKSWELSFPEGVYTVRVEAIDHDRNEGSDEVTVFVGVPAGDTGLDETGDGGSADGEGTSGATSAGEDSDGGDGTGNEGDGTGNDDGSGQNEASDGGCRVGGNNPTPPMWLLLGLLPFALRRRD
ncbi:MAG: hypothetical protein JKY37_27360 [Nannocystaceae bacterium]|nr:hypothetical protein [Nannocystaceae bacterium]